MTHCFHYPLTGHDLKFKKALLLHCHCFSLPKRATQQLHTNVKPRFKSWYHSASQESYLWDPSPRTCHELSCLSLLIQETNLLQNFMQLSCICEDASKQDLWRWERQASNTLAYISGKLELDPWLKAFPLWWSTEYRINIGYTGTSVWSTQN